jgi:hypothetical protein
MQRKTIISRAKKVLQQRGIVAFVGELLFYIFRNVERFIPYDILVRLYTFILPFILFNVKRINEKADLNKSVKFAFNSLFAKLFKPHQIQEEALQLLKILEGIKPKVILEIGTESGGLYSYLLV